MITNLNVRIQKFAYRTALEKQFAHELDIISQCNEVDQKLKIGNACESRTMLSSMEDVEGTT